MILQMTSTHLESLEYSSRVPRVPLNVLQEDIRKKATTGSSIGLSTPSPSKEEDILYCCAMDIPSKIDKNRLYTLKDKYQISDEVNPRLAAPVEWCCTPNFGVGIYEAYLLGGLRLPLNAFC